jgi:hypothetical protein
MQNFNNKKSITKIISAISNKDYDINETIRMTERYLKTLKETKRDIERTLMAQGVKKDLFGWIADEIKKKRKDA